MISIKYRIEFEKNEPLFGILELSEPEAGAAGTELHLVLPLPEDHIKSVKAEMPLAVEDAEKIFMNGYQTWTYCPEYTKTDKIVPMRRVPKPVRDFFGIDRYGDYHFVNYPRKAGVLHGMSWCYFRLGEEYRLLASLDERPGYTLFTYSAEENRLKLERDCAGVKCGGDFHAFDLIFLRGGENFVFDTWFDTMGIKPLTEEKIAGYSSWYNRYEDISEESISRDLQGCRDVLRPGDLFQIDDGWEPAVGDWLAADSNKFPRDMKKAADEIHAAGFKAGLWLAPFVCCKKSEIYKNHKDWLLMVNGKPWYCGCNWGGFYSLDIDNPEVVSYVEESFRRVFDDWGFDLVKLDFLYGAAPYGTETESRAARMTRAMELLRRVCGNKLILGCGVPMMPAFGLVDYCRISCDVGLDLDGSIFTRHANREFVSTLRAMGNAESRRQLNARAWLSDPDVFFLRDKNIKLTEAQKDALARSCALTGGVFLTSDDMTEYDEKKKEAYAEYRKLFDDHALK